MPNTDQENARARQAAQLLLIQYRQHVTDGILQTIGIAGDRDIQNYVKFYDDQPFLMNLMTFDPALPEG